MEGLEAGDKPFGSGHVDADGIMLCEGRNRASGGDSTAHPELAIAHLTLANLQPVAAQRINVDRRDADDPTAVGALDAPVVMVAYSDYQCG